jgi:hypothetical protein
VLDPVLVAVNPIGTRSGFGTLTVAPREVRGAVLRLDVVRDETGAAPAVAAIRAMRAVPSSSPAWDELAFVFILDGQPDFIMAVMGCMWTGSA